MGSEPSLPALVDGELELHLTERTEAERDRAATYRFELRVRGARVGQIAFRAGHGEFFERYAGHVGYGVDPPFRGRRYAARACRLVLAFARERLGYRVVWITCNPENVASRRTCELAGGELVDIVDVPPDTALYREGERQKCRYRFVP